MEKRKIFFSFLVSVLIASSSAGLDVDVKAKIERLIQEVKQAPPSERYKKMNQLKLFVKKLKAEERIKIMKQLHKQLRARGGRHNHGMMHIHKGQKFGKDHMEMRNMKEKYKEHMKNEMHNKEHFNKFHNQNQKESEHNKNNEGHRWQWNHNR